MIEKAEKPEAAEAPSKYLAGALPTDGFVGLDMLLNVIPRGETTDKHGRVFPPRAGRAGVLGIGRTNFYALVNAGVIPPPVKLGRKTLMRVEDVHLAIKRLSSGVQNLSA